MIRKGWLTLEKRPLARQIRTKANLPAREEFAVPRGTVVFTAAGYHLHRRVLLRLEGKAFVDRADSLVLRDRKARGSRFD